MPFITVNGFIYDVGDVVAGPTTSGRKGVLPVVMASLRVLKDTAGAERPLTGREESFNNK